MQLQKVNKTVTIQSGRPTGGVNCRYLFHPSAWKAEHIGNLKLLHRGESVLKIINSTRSESTIKIANNSSSRPIMFVCVCSIVKQNCRPQNIDGAVFRMHCDHFGKIIDACTDAFTRVPNRCNAVVTNPWLVSHMRFLKSLCGGSPELSNNEILLHKIVL